MYRDRLSVPHTSLTRLLPTCRRTPSKSAFLGLLSRPGEYIRIRDESVFLVPLYDGEPGEDVQVGEVGALFEEDDAFGGGQGFG